MWNIYYYFLCSPQTEFVQFGNGGRDRWVSQLPQLIDSTPRDSSLGAVQRDFAVNDYVVLRGLLSPFELHYVHKYYQGAMNIFPNKEEFVISCTNDRIGYFCKKKFRATFLVEKKNDFL